MREFAGKVAVVTGGASGIGLALAHRSAAQGMHVVIGDVEKPALDAALAELRADGAKVEGLEIDVTDEAQMQALGDVAREHFGGVDVFFNNAGVGGGGLSWEMPRSTWEWVLGVNLWGVVNGIRVFVPMLMERPEAHIVNTASVAGLVAAPFMGPYNASKHAVVGISETIFHELAMMAPQVHVSVLCPGWVATHIDSSSRNRPAHLMEGVEPGEAGAVASALSGVIRSGMSPDVVAQKVFSAIEEERFWILTHEDRTEFFVSAIEHRLDSVRDRTNPLLGGNFLG